MKRKNLKMKIYSMALTGIMMAGMLFTSGLTLTVSAADSATNYPLTITDAAGNSVTIEKEPASTVSIAPSNTEILYAIGAGDTVVGRTDYCNYPQEASSVQSIGTYSEPNTELIISLQPDVVFESATSINEDVTKQLEDNGIPVVVLGGNNLDEVEENIALAGEIMNRNSEAETVVSEMEDKRSEVKEAISGQEGKSVFVDLGSYYSVGENTTIGSLLKELNCTNIAADVGTDYPQLSVEQIVSADPQVYISLYTSEDDLKNAPGISSLSCISDGNIICFQSTDEASDMIQRPGPRVADGLEALAKAIYPEAY